MYASINNFTTEADNRYTGIVSLIEAEALKEDSDDITSFSFAHHNNLYTTGILPIIDDVSEDGIGIGDVAKKIRSLINGYKNTIVTKLNQVWLSDLMTTLTYVLMDKFCPFFNVYHPKRTKF